jgi:hypothetical protein
VSTLNARANAYITSSGATWSTTANAVDGVFGATNNTYATFTSLVSAATGYIEVGFGTFLTNNIPANAVITNVAVTIRHLETVAATVPTIRFQPYDGATAIGTAATGTAVVSNHANTTTFTPTLAQVRSANFRIRVTATRAAVTTAGNFSLDNVDVVVTYVAPKIATLTDQFPSSIDATKWPNAYGSAAWSAGQVALPERVANYSGLVSANNAYDLVDSSIFAKFTSPAVMLTSSEMILSAYQDPNNGLWFIIFWNGTSKQLIMRSRAAGVNNDTYDAYDPVLCAYLRIRTVGTTAYWDTSPNAIEWTTRRTLTVSQNLATATVEISAGQWQSEATQGTAYVDNINYAPPMPLISTLTDSFATQIDPLLWDTWGGATWSAGRARLESIGSYQGILSHTSYDFRESSIFAKVAPPVYATSRETQFQVHRLDTNGYVMTIDQSGRLTFGQRAPGGITVLGSQTYDPVVHAWLRLRHSGSTVYFDTSPNGVAWANLYSTTTALDLSSVFPEFVCGQWGTEADTQFAYIDGVNALPEPALVRSGFSVPSYATFVEVDVTGGQSLFVARTSASTTLSSDNPAVTLVKADTVGPNLTSVWAVAPGTAGKVKIIGATATYWGYVLLDSPVRDVSVNNIASNTTSLIESKNLTVTGTPARVVGFWNTGSFVGTWSTPAGYTVLEAQTHQNLVPSWSIGYSNDPASAGTYASPTIDRGLAGTSRTEMVTLATVIPRIVGPSLVRSGRGAAQTYVDIDVTGGRLLFVVRNNSSTSLSSDNVGVIKLAEDTGGPRRNSIWAVAAGTTGIVRITGASSAVWGYTLIDWPAQDAICGYTGNTTTADMGTASLAVGLPAQTVTFWNTNSAADWGTALGYVPLETIITQNSEPSWSLQYSAAAQPTGSYTTPAMSRGKEGSSLIELIAVASVVPPSAERSGRPKVWNGTSWVNKPSKYWTGSAWVEKPMKLWSSSAWKKVP